MLNLAFKPVLVVDDDEVFGTALSRWLLELGYQAVVAPTAQAAIHALTSRSDFALVMLDLGLPDIPGHALLHQLTTQGFDAPVIVVSATEDVSDVVRAWRAHAADFLAKPFGIEDLANAIARVTRPKAARVRAPRARSETPAAPASAPSGGSRPADVAPVSPDDSAEPQAAAPVWTDRPLLDLLNHAIRGGSIEIPVVDPAVANLQQFLTRSDYTMQEVADAVGRDGALASGVLRIANSAQFARGGAVTSLAEACSRLGALRVVGIALEVAVRNQFTLSEEPYRTIMGAVWRNAAATALLAEGLGRSLGRADADDLYLAGLLHNLGEIVCVKLLADADGSGLPLPDRAAMWAEVTEIHERFGRAVAMRWKLPEHLVKIIGHHHRPARTPENSDDRRRRLLVVGAWSLAVENGFAYFPEHAGAESRRYLTTLGVKSQAVDKLVAEIPSWKL